MNTIDTVVNDYYAQIIDIANECLSNKGNENYFYEKKLNEWKPTGNEFQNAPKSVDELKNRIPNGRYRKSHLIGMLQLVGKYEKVTRNDYYNPIFISTTSQSLMDMYGSQKNVHNALKLAQNIGLIEKISSCFRFNANRKSYPQMYIWNKKVQQWIKEICKEEGIVEEIKKNVEEEEEEEKKEKKETENERDNTCNTLVENKISESIYRVGKGLNLPNISDTQVHSMLYRTYPFLKKYEMMADEDNLTLPPCEQIKAKPTIKRNRENTLISSIGYRMTSGIVSLKEHENEHDNYNGVWRREYLNEVFPNGYCEYDVKSSIYRITYWLNDGIWLDNSIDIYEDMYGREFANDNDRKAYKQFCMSLYFDHPNQIYAHKRNLMPKCVEKYGAGNIKEIVARASRLMYKSIGKSYGSEVFVYESCLYMNVVHKMRKMGVRVVQIYDGFYFDREIDVEEIVKECVRELKDDIDRMERNRGIEDRDNTSNTLVENKIQKSNTLVEDEFEKKMLEEQERERIEEEGMKETREEDRDNTSNTLVENKITTPLPTTMNQSELDDFIENVIKGLRKYW